MFDSGSILVDRQKEMHELFDELILSYNSLSDVRKLFEEDKRAKYWYDLARDELLANNCQSLSVVMAKVIEMMLDKLDSYKEDD